VNFGFIGEKFIMKLGAIIEPLYHPQMLQKVAGHLEELSFNSFWYPDEKFFRDCYIGLALVCSVTRSIRCGVCVTDPYTRHPIMTAVSIATLAEIAPGRVWLGMGAGGRGFNAIGIQREKPVVALREAINDSTVKTSSLKTKYTIIKRKVA
jgi:5,10-methylenetetrahydromethanopterin reductase